MMLGEQRMVDVVVEQPRGHRHRYEVGHDGLKKRLQGIIQTHARCPGEYGYIVGTADSGGPLHAVVLTEEATFPGCVITARPIGVLCYERDMRASVIVAVPAVYSSYQEIEDIDSLPGHHRTELRQRIERLTGVQPDRDATVTKWGDHTMARRIINKALDDSGEQNTAVRSAADQPAAEPRGHPGDRGATAPRFAAHAVLGFEPHHEGDTVLAAGVDLASRLGLTLHVVHAINLTDYPVDPDSANWERDGQSHVDADRRRAENMLRRSGITWTYRADRGDPVQLLRGVADEYDALMFIVGSSGEGPSRVVRRLLQSPSVSHALINRTHRPVVVVPPHALEHTAPS